MRRNKIIVFSVLFGILMLLTSPIYECYTEVFENKNGVITTELNVERVKNTGLITKDNPIKQEISLAKQPILLSKVGLFFGTYNRDNLGEITIEIFDKETQQELVNKNINMMELQDNKYFYVSLSTPTLTNSIVVLVSSEESDANNAVTLWTDKEGAIGLEIVYYTQPLEKSRFTLIWTMVVIIIIGLLVGIIGLIKGYVKLIIGIRQHTSNFIKYKTLLKELVIKELKLKYKRSALGFVWSILNPLLMMCIMTLVFSTVFKSDITNFPIYLILGQTIFTFFSEATTGAMGSVVANASLINKVYIPKYIFPMSKVIYALCNLLFSMVAVVIVMIFTRAPITTAIVMFPIGLIYISMFALGIGLILAAYGVFFRDITHLYGVVILAWTYLTPIFYPISIIPEKVLPIVQANPMNHFISFFRQVVMYGQVPSLGANIVCFVYGVLALMIGIVVFYKKQDKFILYI